MNSIFVDTADDSPLFQRLDSTWTTPEEALDYFADETRAAIFPACINGELADTLASQGILPIGSSHTAELLPSTGPTLVGALRAFNFPLHSINGVPCIITTWWNGHSLCLHTVNFSDIEPVADGSYQEVGIATTTLRSESPFMTALGCSLTNLMSRHSYVGPIHLYCRANKTSLTVEGIRFGLDSLTTYTTIELWGTTAENLMTYLVEQNNSMHPRSEFAVGAIVWSDTPIDSQFCQVWSSPVGALVVARSSQTSRGFGEAIRRMYRSIKNLETDHSLVYSQTVGAGAGTLWNRLRWWR